LGKLGKTGGTMYALRKKQGKMRENEVIAVKN
jgi:hypothetical protein